MKMRIRKLTRWLCYFMVFATLLTVSGCRADPFVETGQGSAVAPEGTTTEPSVTESTGAPETTEPVPAATSSGAEHIHNFQETVVSATCENEGYTLHECECGDNFKSDETPALGHKYEQKKVAPTTSSQGYTLYTCSVCSDSYEDDFTDKLVSGNTSTTEVPHNHSYNTKVVNPTCTTPGYTTYTCSCGDSYTDDFIQMKDHSWSEWTITKEATTSSAGESTRTCSVCGSVEKQTISKLPEETDPEPTACQHDWQMKYYPEEGHYGESYNVCKCGFRFDDPSEWREHVKNAGADAAIYHTNWGSTQDYIVDSPERREWICSKCGEVSDTQP